MDISNLTRYKMKIDTSPGGECQTVVSVASTNGKYVKFDDVKELLQTAHNKQIIPCADCSNKHSYRCNTCKFSNELSDNYVQRTA